MFARVSINMGSELRLLVPTGVLSNKLVPRTVRLCIQRRESRIPAYTAGKRSTRIMNASPDWKKGIWSSLPG